MIESASSATIKVEITPNQKAYQDSSLHSTPLHSTHHDANSQIILVHNPKILGPSVAGQNIHQLIGDGRDNKSQNKSCEKAANDKDISIPGDRQKDTQSMGCCFFSCFGWSKPNKTSKKVLHNPHISFQISRQKDKRQLSNLCQKLRQENYVLEKNMIQQKISQITIKEAKRIYQQVQLIDFWYQKAKFYYFFQEYQKSISNLDLIIKKEAQLNEKINIVNIKLFRFMNLCSLGSSQLEKQKYDLKHEYLTICSEIIKSVSSQKQFQMLFFSTSLIYHFILTSPQKYKSQAQQNKIDFSDLNFINEISESITLQMNIGSKDEIKLSLIPNIHQAQLNNSVITPRSQLFDKIIKNKASFEDLKIYKNYPQISAQSQGQHILLSKINFFFQSPQFSNQIPKDQKKQFKFPFWNLSILYIDAYDTQNWLKKYKGGSWVSFSQQKWKKIASYGIGVTIFKGQRIYQQQFENFQYYRNQLYEKLNSLLEEPVQQQPTYQPFNIEGYSQESQGQNLQFPQEIDRFSHLPLKQNRGMRNLGNSCYINSALQCLHKSQHFTEAFPDQLRRIRSWFHTQKVRLCEQYSYFLKEMWRSQKQAFDATSLKRIAAEKNELFRYFSQNDSVQFLATFLSTLSQELNRSQKSVIMTQINHYSKDQQQIYNLTKLKEQSIRLSLVQQTFIGRYRVTYKCLTCQKNYLMFQKFNIHLLQIDQKQNPTLQQSLQLFKKKERLEGSNKMECDQCRIQTDHQKTMQVYQANKIIIFAFKRFHNGPNNGSKNQAFVKIPKILYPEQILSNHKLQLYNGKCYRLYAAIIHVGVLEGGHYTAVCRNYKTKKWMEYNDSFVRELQHIDLSDAYALFYELIDQSMKKEDTTKMKRNRFQYIHKKEGRLRIPRPKNSSSQFSSFQNLISTNLNAENLYLYPDLNTRNKLANDKQAINNLSQEKQKRLNSVNCALQSILRTRYFYKQFQQKQIHRKSQQGSLINCLYKFYLKIKAQKSTSDWKIQLLKINTMVQQLFKHRDKKYPKVMDFLEKLISAYNQERQNIQNADYTYGNPQKIESKLKYFYKCKCDKTHNVSEKTEIISLNVNDHSDFKNSFVAFKKSPQTAKVSCFECPQCTNKQSFLDKKQLIEVKNMLVVELKRFSNSEYLDHQIRIPLQYFTYDAYNSLEHIGKIFQLTAVISFENHLKAGEVSVQYMDFLKKAWMQIKQNKSQQYQMPENPFPRAYILFYELVDRVDGGEVVKMGLSWQK